MYLNSLGSIDWLRALVAFYVERHTSQMPHAAFQGQRPDEVCCGTVADLPAEPGTAGDLARATRLVANRAMSCERCRGRQRNLREPQIPP